MWVSPNYNVDCFYLNSVDSNAKFHLVFTVCQSTCLGIVEIPKLQGKKSKQHC